MKNCKNCGQAMADEAKFCKLCGNVLEDQFMTTSLTSQEDSRQSVVEEKSAFSYYIDALKNYAKFSGRATRKQYWMFVLFYNLIGSAIGFMGFFLDVVASPLYVAGNISRSSASTMTSVAVFIYGVAGLYTLAMFIPALAISWRRMHDVNKSGAWIFINLIPIIGNIWYFVLLCQCGNAGRNYFGMPSQPEQAQNDIPQIPHTPNYGSVYASSNESQNGIAKNHEPDLNHKAKIIRFFNGIVSVGCEDGSFFNVDAKELDFEPVVGDSVFVFTKGEEKIITKNKLF